MKLEEKPKFIDLMEKLERNFKGDVDIKKIDLYFDQLKKYKLHAVERGIDYLISTRVYTDFPIVGHISEAIKESRYNSAADFNKEEV